MQKRIIALLSSDLDLSSSDLKLPVGPKHVKWNVMYRMVQFWDHLYFILSMNNLPDANTMLDLLYLLMIQLFTYYLENISSVSTEQ